MEITMSELERIEAKLEKARANAATAGRAAQEARDTREYDPFVKDRERQAQLQIQEMWNKEVAKLEFERRCALPAGGSAGPSDWHAPSGYFHGADG
jgi:hypothetical protein